MSNENSKASSRLPYRLWLAGIAASSLIAVLVAPATGWLARMQLMMQVPSPAGTPQGTPTAESMPIINQANREERDSIAKRYPTDFPLQLAIVMTNQMEVRLANGNKPGPAASVEILKIKPAFPNTPGLYAAAMRMDTQGWVRVDRNAKQVLSGKQKLVSPPALKNAKPEDLVTFDQEAAEGERLEPDNAYFPFMRSIGLFSAGRDKEGIAAIVRAGNARKWDEHISEEVFGKWHLAEFHNSGRYAIGKIAVAAGILLPHYAQLRNSASLATVEAARLEALGQNDEAFHIRQALMRIGDLMRADASSLIGNLVGIAILQIGMGRPAGIPSPTPLSEWSTDVEREKAARVKFDRLAEYWQKTGHAANVPLARARFEASTATKAMAPKMNDSSIFSEAVLGGLVIRWCAGIILSGSAFWLLLAGGFSSVLMARRAKASPEKMPRSGPLVLAVLIFWILGLGALIAVRQYNILNAFIHIVTAFAGEPGGDRSDNNVTLAILTAAAPFACTLLVLAVSTVVSLCVRTPLRVGIALGFRNAGIPLACILVLVFAGLSISTVREEEYVSKELGRSLLHEGRYLAVATGRTWTDALE